VPVDSNEMTYFWWRGRPGGSNGGKDPKKGNELAILLVTVICQSWTGVAGATENAGYEGAEAWQLAEP